MLSISPARIARAVSFWVNPRPRARDQSHIYRAKAPTMFSLCYPYTAHTTAGAHQDIPPQPRVIMTSAREKRWHGFT
ncbi:hypothetical protein CULC809_02174 [Corynebacterium ulcerans 809]|nr:hypothetical protein CULC809_02174 [Corynebacterium ulcerans 809]